jgi:hypothetical protein
LLPLDLAQTRPLVATAQHWLVTHIYDNCFGCVLIVYRSVGLRKTDSLYTGVQLFLTQPHQLLFQDRMKDPKMMYGKAELSIYQMGENFDASSCAPERFAAKAV